MKVIKFMAAREMRRCDLTVRKMLRIDAHLFLVLGTKAFSLICSRAIMSVVLTIASCRTCEFFRAGSKEETREAL